MFLYSYNKTRRLCYKNSQRGLLVENKDIRDARSLLVVKENELIQCASYNLTMEEMKFLCFVISKIKPTDKELQKYTISGSDFAEVCGLDKRNVYRDFKKMAESFDSKTVRCIKFKDEIYPTFRVFSESSYNTSLGTITVMLHSALKKYLLEIGAESKYTKYELWNIINLKSKYSIRLYELFKSYSYQCEKEFKIDEIKMLLDAEKYKSFGNLKQRVLDGAIKEINILTDLAASYEAKKSGRGGKVTSIVFKIKKKKLDDKMVAYYENIDMINTKNKQCKGQMSMFDPEIEDKKDYSQEVPVIPSKNKK